MQAKQYDYIFLGTGCSSLSIVMRMIASKKFSNKKILIIDKEDKSRNDRTWCFWEKSEGFFEKIVYRKWQHLFFKTDDKSIALDIGLYKYKMIRGIDFYEHCFSSIELQKNIDIIHGMISFENKDSFAKIKVNGDAIEFNEEALVFNSVYRPAEKQKNKFYLLQHFKGWVVETSGDFFNADHAVLMDFRVSQQHGTTFVYVLPLSSTKALVEYTLFTKNVLSQHEYDTALKHYLKEFLNLDEYKVIDEEYGVIPMTNANFPVFGNSMYYIGTAGGQTKASTGYTFRFIQNQADTIVKSLVEKNMVSRKSNVNKRFYFYDSTLLHILSKSLLGGKIIFTILFEKNRAETVLKFLDNETNISEEIKLLNSLPKKIFIKAGFKELMKMMAPK